MSKKQYTFATEMPQALRVKTVNILRDLGYRANVDGDNLTTNAPAAVAKDCLVYRPSGSPAAEF